jgi:hypothetical protein
MLETDQHRLLPIEEKEKIVAQLEPALEKMKKVWESFAGFAFREAAAKQFEEGRRRQGRKLQKKKQVRKRRSLGKRRRAHGGL